MQIFVPLAWEKTFHKLHLSLSETLLIFYKLSIYIGHIQHNCAHSPTITVAKLQSNFALINDTPYPALTGKLWGVFHELFKEKWRDISRASTYLKNKAWWCLWPSVSGVFIGPHRSKLMWNFMQNEIFFWRMWILKCHLQNVSHIVEALTHWGLVMPFGDIDLGQHCLR